MRRLVFCALLVTPAVVMAWDTPAPRGEAEKETVRYGGTLRAQLRYKDWLPMFETNYRIEGGNQGNPRPDGISLPNVTDAGTARFSQQTWYAMLGGYYNIFNYLMVGGFYRYGQGERHRNDWIGSGWAPGAASNVWDWFWLNVNNRPEQSVIGDITVRQKVPFINENLVFELKNRVMYTWYTDSRYANRDNWGQSTDSISETKYILRPGLQYFWMDGDRPFMTFFLQYEAHFALNFGVRNLVESWGYLGFLYNITDEVALGFNIARAQWWWSTSNSVQNIGAVAGNCATTVGGAIDTPCNTINYVTTQRAWVLGFTAMLRLDFTPIE